MSLPSSHSRRAFTLIELLVVIALIGLLMSIVIPGLNRAIRTTKRNKAVTETKSIAAAVDMFFREYGYLPMTEADRGSDRRYEEEASKSVVVVLMGEDPDDLNYKNTSFLNIDALSTDGTLPDPWGEQYVLLLDGNMDQRLEYNDEEYRKRAIVVSTGSGEDIASVVSED